MISFTKTQFIGRSSPTPVSIPFANNKNLWYKSIVRRWPKIMESVARFSHGNLGAKWLILVEAKNVRPIRGYMGATESSSSSKWACLLQTCQSAIQSRPYCSELVPHLAENPILLSSVRSILQVELSDMLSSRENLRGLISSFLRILFCKYFIQTSNMYYHFINSLWLTMNFELCLMLTDRFKVSQTPSFLHSLVNCSDGWLTLS